MNFKVSRGEDAVFACNKNCGTKWTLHDVNKWPPGVSLSVPRVQCPCGGLIVPDDRHLKAIGGTE